MSWRHIFHFPAFFSSIFGSIFIFSISDIEFRNQKMRNDTGYELTSPLLKWMSGGFWVASCDALWLQVVQELGENQLNKEGAERVKRDYRLMQELDPFFFDTYEQAGLAMDLLFRDADAALEILDRGIRVFENQNPPKAFWNRVYALYLQRALVAAHRKLDFASARRDYLKASEAPGAPAYLSQMRIWLQKPGSEKTLAKKMLPILISNTSDPTLREFYKKQLERTENE